jgi:hypothetical protein
VPGHRDDFDVDVADRLEARPRDLARNSVNDDAMRDLSISCSWMSLIPSASILASAVPIKFGIVAITAFEVTSDG